MKKLLKIALVIVVVLILIVLFKPDSNETEKELGELRWPSSPLSQMLPTPDSTVGEVTLESLSGLMIDVGNTSEDAYNAYIESCKEKGFTVDYKSGSGFYYADNSDGYSLSLYYDEEEEIMTISLHAPSEESTEEASSEQQTENTQEESSSDTSGESENLEEPEMAFVRSLKKLWIATKSSLMATVTSWKNMQILTMLRVC